MHRKVRKILASSLIVLLALPMTFHAAVAEEQTPQPIVQVKEAPAEPDATPATQPSEAPKPEAQAASAAPEATEAPEATSGAELVEIQDGQVPLAGGPAVTPTVTIRANRDLTGLSIGDALTLTCELAGFSGLNPSIHWQALVNGQWKDLPNENAAKLVIRITADNADWSYRAAVDAQPVV